MMDITSVVEAGMVGLGGGVVYSYFNKLMTVKTYLQAIEHAAAGFVVGALAVVGALGGGYSVPVDYASALPIASLGYAGVDVIDSLSQKLASASAPAAPAAPAAAATPASQ